MQLQTFSEKIGLQLKETLREQKFSRDKTKNKGLNISIGSLWPMVVSLAL